MKIYLLSFLFLIGCKTNTKSFYINGQIISCKLRYMNNCGMNLEHCSNKKNYVCMNNLEIFENENNF